MRKLETINFYNANGNVASKVRADLKDGTIATAMNMLSKLDAVENVNGGVSIPLARNERGEIVYAHMLVTVSTSDPSVKKEKKKSSKSKPKAEAKAVDLSGIFAVEGEADAEPEAEDAE